MESLQSEDGQHFIRSLAQFIRQHEKALANSLQLSVHRRPSSRNASSTDVSGASPTEEPASPARTTSLAAAFSFAGLNFRSSSVKAAHLTLTPHHLFYLLSRFEALSIAVGPMNVRLESIQTDLSPSNYVSFLQTRQTPYKGRSDRDSIHSISSMRSVMSSMSALWSSIGLGSSISRSEKAKAATEADLKYLYSAFTKLPSLRLTADHRARLVKGYEEFPFDTAVPLFVFKNLQQLDIVDIDFRNFYGWDRLAENVCLLTVKRAKLEDLADLLTHIVLDDAEKRRRRSTKSGLASSPTISWTVPSTPRAEYARSHSDPESPAEESPRDQDEDDHMSPKGLQQHQMSGSVSPPKRISLSRPSSSYRHVRTYSTKAKRTTSGSSNSSDYSFPRSQSASDLPAINLLPSAKWQRLKYLSVADNGLTSLSAKSLAPIATTLRSLNLSSNLFAEIPDSISTLTRLVSLDLSNCMIESLQSLLRSPLPAITTIKLRSNRLRSLAGVERLLSLENIDIRDNLISDPVEAARLTGIPNLHRVLIKNNPLTKTFPDFRVTIFNIFRRTPGYVEDIVIDEHPPTYSERKLLVERVPEIARRPSSTAIQIVEPAVHPQRLVSTNSTPPEAEAAGPVSSRRKRAPRRRIVDLAHDEGTFFTPPPAEEEDFGALVPTVKPLQERSDSAPAVVLSGNTTIEPQEPIKVRDELNSSDFDLTPDAYRAKIETLRQEFGSNWISALSSDRSYRPEHLHSAGMVPPFSHTTPQRASSQLIVSGGRTLG